MVWMDEAIDRPGFQSKKPLFTICLTCHPYWTLVVDILPRQDDNNDQPPLHRNSTDKSR